MRIAYYNRLLNEPWGCGIHGRALVEAWSAAGHNVLCLPAPLRREAVSGGRSRVGRLRNMPPVLRYSALDARARYVRARSFGSVLRRLEDFRPDVLIARRAAYDYLLDALLRRIDVPVVGEVNAILGWELPEMEGQTLPAWETDRERRFLLECDGLAAVSDSIGEQLAELGVQASRIHVVPNGVDVDRFDPNGTPDEQAAQWAHGDRRVVAYCGTFAPNHDMHALAEASKRLFERGNVRLMFIGPTREEMERVLPRTMVADDAVLCTGRVPHVRVPGLLKTADVAWAALSNDRGSALKLFEYMSMARPVVIADGSQGRDIVRDAECGFAVPVGDHAALADAAGVLVDDPARARTLGTNGRAWVERHASWRAVAQGMLEAIDV